ncbi:super-infection exclusion protein B [Pedobacter sp. R-06]|uniref:super-infection exclusion protein B n=1 Tax=Pedobacter sp. R-06 TaxID=3404051 RepID=UPI003CEA3204
MEWIKIFQIGKIPIRIVLLISITSGLLLFLPKPFLQTLQLDPFIKEYGRYIGIAFVASAGFLLLGIAGWCLQQLGRWWQTIRFSKAIKRNLMSLDNQEKSVLREFIFTDSSTLPLPMQNATVAGLVNKRILYQIGNYGGLTFRDITFNYGISSTAKRKLTLEMIGAPGNPSGQFSEEDKIWLRNNRPSFMTSRNSLW